MHEIAGFRTFLMLTQSFHYLIVILFTLYFSLKVYETLYTVFII